MAKSFAVHMAPTNHGGMIPATQSRSSQQGNLFVRAGDGHMCPKCKCWSVVIKSHDHVIFDGKPVAYVGDSLSCGAKIVPQQFHVVGDSGSPYSSAASSTAPVQDSLVEDKSNEIHKVQFKLVDVDTNQPLSAMLYEIHSKESGKLLVQGYTDKNGMTAIYESENKPESVELITVDLSKPLDPL
ncbi:PAAR domain-containing protein [Acinetobacter baumannii]|uniref:PAAR domain-containing protein n=1 Tax=Acinetobacter baumannii TaxID=470 RepID=UPI001C0C6755|nr:PAAR domain-containing protein [Acinetobacter baumannii]MBU3096743.1 PAAR domain-containing protein [Acinetobacter baumannii]MDO7434396.1 PAAR domain-containing protein [Acinetobacter baumannii]MDV7546413.1 PAAR domain-containing protein [Acinetobacter baumannii]